MFHCRLRRESPAPRKRGEGMRRPGRNRFQNPTRRSRPTCASLRCDGTACPGGRGVGRAGAHSRARLVDRRAHCVAAVERERPRARAAFCASAANSPPSTSRGVTSKAASQRRRPARNKRGRPAWSPKSTICRAPPSATTSIARSERLAPRRDHRQRVGDEHAIEGGAAEQRLRIEIARVALGQRRRGRRARRGGLRRAQSPASRSTRRGRRRAALGKRRATAMRLRPVPQPISSTVSPARRQSRDRTVAAEKIVLARRVVDMALAPVHAVHQQGGVAHAARS